MNSFTIRDIENLTGVKAHTIRIWEQRYNFLKPQRTGTNIRYYSNEELKSVLNISLLNKYGYKISHINKMDEFEIRQKILMLGESDAKQQRILNDLISCMIDLEAQSFEDLLNNEIQALGIEHAVDHIIFPFLEKIGVLWLTGNVNTAQEHLVSNIIRQKLLVAIEAAEKPVSDKTAILFLPEGQHHELGLIYVHYLCKVKGITAIYLGADVPLADLEFVIKLKKPSYLYTHIIASSQRFNLEKFISNLHQKVGEVPVMLSGPLTHSFKKDLPPNFIFITSLHNLKESL